MAKPFDPDMHLPVVELVERLPSTHMSLQNHVVGAVVALRLRGRTGACRLSERYPLGTKLRSKESRVPKRAFYEHQQGLTNPRPLDNLSRGQFWGR